MEWCAGHPMDPQDVPIPPINDHEEGRVLFVSERDEP
jgi:hypothetical protein